MYSGRFSSLDVYVMTVIAPWMSPAAPVPAMALPSMKAAEVGAAAHNVEPAMEALVDESLGHTHPRGRKMTKQADE